MTLILVGIPFLSFHFITYLEKIIQAVITKAENDFFGPRSPQYYSFNLTVLYAFLSGTGLLWFLPWKCHSTMNMFIFHYIQQSEWVVNLL